MPPCLHWMLCATVMASMALQQAIYISHGESKIINLTLFNYKYFLSVEVRKVRLRTQIEWHLKWNRQISLESLCLKAVDDPQLSVLLKKKQKCSFVNCQWEILRPRSSYQIPSVGRYVHAWYSSTVDSKVGFLSTNLASRNKACMIMRIPVCAYDHQHGIFALLHTSPSDGL